LEELTDGSETTLHSHAGGGGDVTAAAALTDNRLVRGDTASKAVQTSGITLDDGDGLSGLASIYVPVVYCATNLTFNLQGDTIEADVFLFETDGIAELIADSTHQAYLSAKPEIKQTDTASYTAFEVDVAETSVGSGTKLLLDLLLASASKFSVDNAGNVAVAGTVDGVDIAARDHAESHTVASHSDTTATGSELETLTDGSDASQEFCDSNGGGIMTKRIKNYTWSPGGAGVGTVTFTDFTAIALDAIVIISNETYGTIIFNFGEAGKTGTVATNVLTLATSTTGMSSGDKLKILYDDVDDGPQVKVIEITAANATDATLLTVASGKKVVLTQCEVFADNGNTVDVEVKMALGATGATANFAWDPGIAKGSGFIKRLDEIKGTNGQDVVYQNTVPTGGSITMGINYYLVDA
jgi:hypothetical protein